MKRLLLWLAVGLKAMTPFVFLLDLEYKRHPRQWWIDQVREKMKLLKPYEGEFFDCDDAAAALKGLFSLDKENGIGVVYGKSGGAGHAWNIILLDDRVAFLEPHTGYIFDGGHGYRSFVVVL